MKLREISLFVVYALSTALSAYIAVTLMPQQDSVVPYALIAVIGGTVLTLVIAALAAIFETFIDNDRKLRRLEEEFVDVRTKYSRAWFTYEEDEIFDLQDRIENLRKTLDDAEKELSSLQFDAARLRKKKAMETESYFSFVESDSDNEEL